MNKILQIKVKDSSKSKRNILNNTTMRQWNNENDVFIQGHIVWKRGGGGGEAKGFVIRKEGAKLIAEVGTFG